jgi:hypothetical protein
MDFKLELIFQSQIFHFKTEYSSVPAAYIDDPAQTYLQTPL